MIIYICSTFIIAYSVLYLLGTLFQDKKCVSCRFYGDRDYMDELPNKKFKHPNC